VLTLPERLEPALMARRVALEFHDGAVVNLGMGLPLLCSDYVPDGREVLLHSEQGIVGFGPLATRPEEVDLSLMNAGGLPVTPLPGMVLMTHDESFAIIRGGHIDVTVLGGLQVGANGDLANSHRPGRVIGNIGGAQDLAACARRVIVLMHHTTEMGDLKLVDRCSLPLTAPRCVDLVVTDVGVFEPAGGAFLVREVAPDWSIEQIQSVTGAPVRVADDCCTWRFD
jgi:3-oxoadipate CoA-transferase, beta subunit